jgi:hypothetical protein|tara:strand:+ start:366 stop:800 length:435 start_codon:yes stop_codon:yes gene_type:complete
MTLNITEIVEVFGNETALKVDGYDDCIVGVDGDGRLVYDRMKMLDKLGKDMSSEEAEEYFEFNIAGSHMGEMNPLYIHLLSKDGSFCEHINTEYQPEEVENNASESLICLDCGKDLEPPEPDWDLELRNSPLGAGFAHKDIKEG